MTSKAFIQSTSEQERAVPGLGRFLQLLSVLQRVKGDVSTGGLFAFTSALTGEGVSFVANAFASELALLPKERIFLTDASALSCLTRRDLEPGAGFLRENSPRLHAVRNKHDLAPSNMLDLHPDVVEDLRRLFTYVLIDCRALRSSPEVLRIASQIDGVILVVGAGRSKRDQVVQAQKVLQLAADNFLGCIFNGQKLPRLRFTRRYFTSEVGGEKDAGHY